MDETPIDRAHRAMQAAPEDERARLRFYARVAESELHLLLAEEPSDNAEAVSPEIFELGEESYALAFDREARLADFAGKVVPYAALSGRLLVTMLAEQRLGLGLNLDVAPSAILLPVAAVDWMRATLDNAPAETAEAVVALHKPSGLPEDLLAALDGKLAAAAGLADAAYLASVTYKDGQKGHLLGFVAALPEAEAALAQAVAEALTFSGIDAGHLDVAFFRAGEPIVERLGRVGLRFDLPRPEQPLPRQVPGGDPARPPKLR